MSDLVAKRLYLGGIVAVCSIVGYFLYDNYRKEHKIQDARQVVKKLLTACQKNIQQEIHTFLNAHPNLLEAYRELQLKETMVYNDQETIIKNNFDTLVSAIRKIIIAEAAKYKKTKYNTKHNRNKKIDDIKIWNAIFYNNDNYELLNSIIIDFLSDNEKFLHYML